jgi:4-oxalocrotonate tautomerase
MPIVNIVMIKGRTTEQKKALFREVTDAINRTVGAPKENIRIMLQEVAPEDFAVAGVPKSEPSS